MTGQVDERTWLAKEYRLVVAIQRDDLESVRGLLGADPALMNIPAPKRPLDTRFMPPLQAALCTGWHKEIVGEGGRCQLLRAKEVMR